MSFRVLLLGIIAIALSDNRLTAQPKVEEGFRSLFDGKTLTGWHVMNKAKFTAEDEVIKLRGGSGWLRSDEEYSDFVLRLEVRWMKPKQDSGVFIRASKEGKNWPDRRYEVQCENSARVAHIFGAKCTRDAKKAEQLLKAPKEWNSFEVSCIGARCEVKLNNELVCTSDDLKMANGFIGLQGEGGELEFRNVRIKKIDSSKLESAANKILPQGAPGDWPWWRGPGRNGISADREAVTKWSPKENVVWATNVPGQGHSSPIVCGNRVFLTTAEEKTQKQLILAFDRQTGKPLWSTLAHQGNFTRKYSKNSHASATQACDRERVFSVFVNSDGLHVTATDLDGKILWQKRAGEFHSLHGYGSSPVLYKNLVIVNGDNVKTCYLTALDVETGKVVWHTERNVVGKYGNYGTPVLAVVSDRVQLLQAGLGRTASYDPDTGKLLWSCTGPAEVTANTLAFSATTVFSSGGFPEKELRAIRGDGKDDVSQSHLAWKTDKGITYVPSPLYHAGFLYLVNDGGIASCIDAESGKQIWQERLQGNFSSSPVLVGDLLYATNEAGLTSIFKARQTFELVGANSLQESVMATPAVCGGQIFLRTASKLYCLGASKGR